jgi:hypothetical protein
MACCSSVMLALVYSKVAGIVAVTRVPPGLPPIVRIACGVMARGA